MHEAQTFYREKLEPKTDGEQNNLRGGHHTECDAIRVTVAKYAPKHYRQERRGSRATLGLSPHTE